jgi:glutathione S-transferase
LYDSKLSGNSWKVRLLLRYLEIPFARETLNLAQATPPHKTQEFKAKNLFRRIPVVELEDGRCLAESNSILLFFADGTSLLPKDGVERARVTAWLMYEQADLLRFLAYPRFYANTGQAEAMSDVIGHYRTLGEAALVPVEETLRAQDWLYDGGVSVADFALYPYVKLSPEGGYDLSRRPSINAWISRVEKLPGYEPLVTEHPSRGS